MNWVSCPAIFSVPFVPLHRPNVPTKLSLNRIRAKMAWMHLGSFWPFFLRYRRKKCGSWEAAKTLVNVTGVPPTAGHFQPGRVGANWCGYGERNDETKRHDEGREAVVSRSGALHRDARLRTGRQFPSKQPISS